MNNSKDSNVDNKSTQAVQANQTSASGNESTDNNGAKKKSTKKRTLVPLWAVVNPANKAFNAQLHRSNELKRECLEKHLATANDREAILCDYFAKMNLLLDSKRYEAQCIAAGYDPFILATHIVFLGSSAVNEVRNKGIEGVDAKLKNKFPLYKEEFLPRSMFDFKSESKDSAQE